VPVPPVAARWVDANRAHAGPAGIPCPGHKAARQSPPRRVDGTTGGVASRHGTSPSGQLTRSDRTASGPGREAGSERGETQRHAPAAACGLGSCAAADRSRYGARNAVSAASMTSGLLGDEMADTGDDHARRPQGLAPPLPTCSPKPDAEASRGCSLALWPRPFTTAPARWTATSRRSMTASIGCLTTRAPSSTKPRAKTARTSASTEVFGCWSRALPPTSGSSTTLTLQVEESGHTEVSRSGC
jgi:hypothetical protein